MRAYTEIPSEPDDELIRRDKKGRALAAMGQVIRTDDGFEVTTTGRRKEVLRVWRDIEGQARCSCAEFVEHEEDRPRFRCQHILAVKYYLEPPIEETAKPEPKAEPPASVDPLEAMRGEMLSLRNRLAAVEARLSTLEPKPYERTEDPVARTLSDLVTPKQLVAIRAIANAAGVNADTRSLETFNCRPEELTKSAASVLIDDLKGGVHPAARRAS